jgi:uncharacterized RDD family membrane protein YckC
MPGRGPWREGWSLQGFVDTVRRVETPEGVELMLRPAGPVARGLAAVLDLLVVTAALVPAFIAMAFLGPLGDGLGLILTFLALWFYPVFSEVLWQGRTLGKRWVGLQVLTRDGRPVGWGPSLLRNIVRFVDFLPFCYAVGFLSLMLSRDFRRLGDLVADTWVVHQEGRAPARILPDVPPLAPPVALDLDAQSALTAFAERSGRFTPARARELSDLLEPLSGATGEEGLARILGIARHLWGGK